MEPNPLLSDPAPSTPGPDVPLDPEALWDEAQRQALDEPEDDPFGFGGGLDFLDDQTEGLPTIAPPNTAHHSVTHDPHIPAAPASATLHADPASPRQSAWMASASSHGYLPCPCQPATMASASSHGTTACPRQPASMASASTHGAVFRLTTPAPGTPVVSSQPAAEYPASHTTSHCRTDRRSALIAHLAATPRQASTTGTPAAAEREAELLQATARLQQRCATLAADLASAQARQGPLLQRLHRAGRAFAELVTPSPSTAAQMPFPTLHSVLSTLRGASSGAPH